MEIIVKLQDPHYVVRLQQFFGLWVIKSDENRNNALLHSCSVTTQHESYTCDNGLSLKERLKSKNLCTTNNGMCLSTGDTNNTHKPDNSTNEPPFIIKNKPLHYIFKFASLLGHEPFYLLFYPLLGWNADFYITRVTALLWCMIMYLGQATKDVLRWPRPRFPPVLNLETQYMLEYGMPSTHAMAGTAMPFTLAYFISSRYNVSGWLLLGVAVVWSSLVCTSRLYLGVHFVGDVIVGVFYSVVIMVVMLPGLPAFDYFLQTSLIAPVILLCIAILLCTKLYPSKTITSAKIDCCNIVAVIYGVTLGAWLNYNVGIIKMPEGIQVPYVVGELTLQWIVLSLIRLLVGTVIVGFVKFTLSAVLVPILTWILTRKSSSNSIGFFCRFLTYCTLGICISCLVPYLFYLLNIDRPGFYTEGS